MNKSVSDVVTCIVCAWLVMRHHRAAAQVRMCFAFIIMEHVFFCNQTLLFYYRHPAPSSQRAVAVRAARTYGGEELQTLLKETGLGNHPVIVKTFYAIGRATGEDASTGGPAAAQTDKTFAQALYGAN